MFKRITDRMPFVVHVEHGKLYFKRKKIRTKKNSLLNWEEKRREKRKKNLKNTAGKSSIKKN
jgi:hypothetical protein